jgi:hypothetical protein
MPTDGIVRLNHTDDDRANGPRFLGVQVIPFGKRGSAVVFGCIAAVEMTVEVDVVVDSGMS